MLELTYFIKYSHGLLLVVEVQSLPNLIQFLLLVDPLVPINEVIFKHIHLAENLSRYLMHVAKYVVCKMMHVVPLSQEAEDLNA